MSPVKKFFNKVNFVLYNVIQRNLTHWLLWESSVTPTYDYNLQSFVRFASFCGKYINWRKVLRNAPSTWSSLSKRSLLSRQCWHNRTILSMLSRSYQREVGPKPCAKMQVIPRRENTPTPFAVLQLLSLRDSTLAIPSFSCLTANMTVSARWDMSGTSQDKFPAPSAGRARHPIIGVHDSAGS